MTMPFYLSAWFSFVAAALAVIALFYRFRVERRAVLFVKFPPLIWLSVIYLFTGMQVMGLVDQASPTASTIRLAVLMLLCAIAFVDWVTGREIRRLRVKR